MYGIGQDILGVFGEEKGREVYDVRELVGSKGKKERAGESGLFVCYFCYF